MSRVFSIFLTIGGCGNHLVKDFLNPLDVSFVPVPLVEFWACLVQARHNPDQATISDWFPGQTAIEAMRSYYARYEMDEISDPLHIESATQCFAKALNELESDRLFTHHLFCFLTSSDAMRTSVGQEIVWPLAYAHEAMSLLENALDDIGWERRYVALVRHPIDIFISNSERFGMHTDSSEFLRHILEFSDAVEHYLGKTGYIITMCQYEEICQRDTAVLRQLLDTIGLHEQPLETTRLDILHKGGLEKYYSGNRKQVIALSKELAHPLRVMGYTMGDLSVVTFLRRRLAEKWRRWLADKANYDKIFSGDFSIAGAIFHHHRSVAIRIYWQLSMLIPNKRKNYTIFYESETKGPMPTPRCERPFRYLLGMNVSK